MYYPIVLTHWNVFWKFIGFGKVRVVSRPRDDLCICIWMSAMIISQHRKQRDMVQQCTRVRVRLPVYSAVFDQMVVGRAAHHPFNHSPMLLLHSGFTIIICTISIIESGWKWTFFTSLDSLGWYHDIGQFQESQEDLNNLNIWIQSNVFGVLKITFCLAFLSPPETLFLF